MGRAGQGWTGASACHSGDYAWGLTFIPIHDLPRRERGELHWEVGLTALETPEPHQHLCSKGTSNTGAQPTLPHPHDHAAVNLPKTCQHHPLLQPSASLPSRDPGRGADCCHYPCSRWGPAAPWQPCLLPSTLPPAPAGNHSCSLRAADNGHPAPSCLHPTTRECPHTQGSPGPGVHPHHAQRQPQCHPAQSWGQCSCCTRTHLQLCMGTTLPSAPACSRHGMQTHASRVPATRIWWENPRAEWGRTEWHETE